MLDLIENNEVQAPRQPNRQQVIRDVVEKLGYPSDWEWAWDNYKPLILALSNALDLNDHIEIGGGRDCLFSDSELKTNGFSVTINDISATELALAPSFAKKVLCDIAAKDAPQVVGHNAYDFAYCRMVMEHVHDVRQMWQNLGQILKPGGVALSFFPTLYAPPFALNKLLPENLSRAILHRLFPDRRSDGDNPKFPAFYDLCRSSEKTLKPILLAEGFSDVVVLPFYGYSYFDNIPGLKQVDAAFTRLAQKRDWRMVSSFAYVIATKGE